MAAIPHIRKRVRSVAAVKSSTIPNRPAPPDGAQEPSLRWADKADFKLLIEQVKTADLKVANRQTRRRKQKAVVQLAASIRKFGFVNPIITGSDNKVIAGHGRLDAARLLGLETVPTISVDYMTGAERRAYALADNKLAELSDWDEEVLALELAELCEIELDFELEVTGFSALEIERLTESAGQAPPLEGADDVPEVAALATSALGDRWLLGDHVVVCGDSTKPSTYALLLREERARMVFVDAPYNVRVRGNVSGLGKVKHREFVQATGEMSEVQFRDFLKASHQLMAAHSVDGAIHFSCMDWRGIAILIEVCKEVYSEFKQLCVWAKSNAGMGTFYRSQHELVAVFKVGTAPHTNTFGLGETGRARTNLWSYPGANTFHQHRDDELAMHPTVKPVVMVMDAIKDCSFKGEIVLDVFGGSGTTLVAAEKTGRRARLIELDPLYVDVTVRRWEKLTGKTAVLDGDGRSFAEISSLRVEASVNG